MSSLYLADARIAFSTSMLGDWILRAEEGRIITHVKPVRFGEASSRPRALTVATKRSDQIQGVGGSSIRNLHL